MTESSVSSTYPQEPLVQDLLRRSELWLAEAEPLLSCSEMALIASRIGKALDTLKTEENPKRPLLITLLGGTGVGKSTLLNTLVGAEISNTSSAVRPCTKQPLLYCHPQDRATMLFPKDLPVDWVDGTIRNVVLCDTPDIDGLYERNWELTRRMVERSDIVVFVTNDTKYANATIHEEIRTWAVQKRWFFVMTHVSESKIRELGTSFDTRLKDLGFEPSAENRFLVDSHAPNQFDFPRLRQTLLQPRSEEQIWMVRQDAFLARLLYAFDEEKLQTLISRREKLQKQEQEQLNKIHDAYKRALRNPQVKEAFQKVVREAIWRNLGQQGWLFLSIPIGIRCRFASLWLSYNVSRMFTSGLTMGGLVGIGISGLQSLLMGSLPLREIAQALGPDYRLTLHQVEEDSRRLLRRDGYGMLILESTISPTEAEAKTTSQVANASITETIEHWLKRMTLADADQEIVQQLTLDVQQVANDSGRKLSRSLAGWLNWFVGNGLILGMLGWILYRVGLAWWNQIYLALPFYGMSLALLLASFLFGFLWLYWRVGRCLADTDPAVSIQAIAEPNATRYFRLVRQKLTLLQTQGEDLRQELIQAKQILSQEGLSEPVFGTTVHNR